MQATWRAATVTFLGLLGGCSLAPTYKTPSSPQPADAYAEAGDWRKAEPLEDRARGAWWTMFQDPVLDSLEVKVGNANQNIKAAFARLEQARAATRIARADLLPTLNVGSSATRARISQNSPVYVPGRNPTYNNFGVEADLSYELDLWGRVRNSVNSAKANQQASAADLAALDLEQHAELAGDYYTLRGEDAEEVLLLNTVDDYSRSLALTENLYRGGAAAVADVDQARAQLEGARTQAADVALQRAQTEHAIAVLVGENPSRFHLAANPLRQDSVPPLIDVGLPSTLLATPRCCRGGATGRRRQCTNRRRAGRVFSCVQPRRRDGIRQHAHLDFVECAEPALVGGSVGAAHRLRRRAASRAIGAGSCAVR